MSIAAAHQALRLRLSRGVRHHSNVAMHHGQRAPDSLDRADRADARNGARASLSSSALVTGASGFVGSAIAAALRTRGQCRVVAFVRSSSPRTNLDPGDAVVVGDLNDRAALAAALKGVRFLFHAAADYRLWARDPDEITRNNVEGTRHIMEEALKAGVERIVYTSSVATLKIVEGAPATEEDRLAEERGDRRLQAEQGRRGAPRRGDDRKGRFACRHRQSLDADRAARRQADADRPDHHGGGVRAHAGLCRYRPQSRSRRRCCRRPSGGPASAGVSASATFSAAKTSSSPTCWRTSRIWSAGGRRRLKLPRRMLYPVAYGAELMARLRGGEPFATVDGLRMASQHMFFDDSQGAP